MSLNVREVGLRWTWLVLLTASCGTSPDVEPASLENSAQPAADPPAPPTVLVGSVPFLPEDVQKLAEFSPLPEPPDDPTNDYDLDPAAARLGQFLFFDKRLSRDGSVGCVTCHDPEKGWSDGRRQSVGLAPLPRHSLTLWNAVYQRWFFWDGRRDTLWAQALGPLEDPREHGLTRVEVARFVAKDDELAAAYEAVFGRLPSSLAEPGLPERARPIPDRPDHPDARAWSGMNEAQRDGVNRVFANVGKSIAAFEREIVGRRAPFDVFVEGVFERDEEKQQAVDDSVRRGFLLFSGKGQCLVCHSGPTFSDLEFHNDRVPPYEAGDESDTGRFLGVRMVQADPFNGLGPYSDAPDHAVNDKLRYLIRGHDNLAEFKTPSLRNVAVTAPYMHQGQIATLEEVVEHYSTLAKALPEHHERRTILKPANFDEGEKQDLLAFLHSLTDTTMDPELMRAPTSPRLEE